MDIVNFFNKHQSKNIAKDRLKFVLVNDRNNCSVQVLEMIKKDIVKVISSYMKIDEKELEIEIMNLQVDEKFTSKLKKMLHIRN